MGSLVPAVVLALFAAWCGTLPGGASALGAIGAHAALLGLAALGLDRWSDPLGQAKTGRVALGLAAVLALGSLAASPVPRAGRTGLVVAALLLLVPAAVARLWATPEARRRGSLAVALVAVGIAGWALADRFALGSPRAAMPLGHHVLAAAWLVVVLPLALTAWAARRWVAVVVAVVGGAALVATGSRAGLLAATVQVAVFLWEAATRERRRSRWARGGALAALAVAGTIALRLAAPGDPSVTARRGYLAGALAGISERPLLGWGPGAAPWTAALYLRPRPGLNPPGEALADLHSLPAHVAFELGVPLLLLLAGMALLALRRRPAPADALARGGRISGVGAAVVCLGSASLAVTALPLALAVAVGATLPVPPPASRRVRLAGWAGWLVAIALLVPVDLAQAHWQRALRSPGEEARRSLARAVALDPGFPLYRARQAWLAPRPSVAAAEEAYRAARDAVGVPALWWLAGRLGMEASRPWGAEALAEAWRLDPLVAVGPYLLSEAGGVEAARWGARAVLVEPILGASLAWAERPGFLEEVASALRSWPGLEPPAAERLAAALEGPRTDDGTRDLVFGFDGQPATSVTLHTFRRSGWPLELLRVPLSTPAVHRLSQVAGAPHLAAAPAPR